MKTLLNELPVECLQGGEKRRVASAVPGGSGDLQEAGVACKSRGGHEGVLRIIFRHNLKLDTSVKG